MCIGAGNNEIVSVYAFFQDLIVSFFNINLIQLVCKQQKQLVILAYIGKSSRSFFKNS